MHIAVRRKIAPSIDPRYARFPLRVGRSRIHGFGVFAVETIPRGRKVIEYTGERLNLRQARARHRKVWGRGGTKIIALFGLNRYWSLDGAVGGSGAERINHSCDPNLQTRRIRGHILLFSRRRIRPREELTVDYRFPARAERVVCCCGSPECRGTMNRK
jgi:SET domain-containing protein